MDDQVFNQYTEEMDHDFESYNNSQNSEEMHITGQVSSTSDTHDTMVMQAYHVVESEESMLDPAVKPKAVHQCPVCNKIFVSFKGLQQHAIIHTDQKPYSCDICGKSFRFKSNLFEHRSVHTGTTPHQCPICGKTCRLKGNLKKHLRTHCTTKEELELAWQPFASNRRAPAEIPRDAIIIRPNADSTSLFATPYRPKKRKLGLGAETKVWIEKIRRGELLPGISISDKMRRILDLVKITEDGAMDMENLFHHARAIPLEQYDCPVCKTTFFSRIECHEHIESEHSNVRKQRPHFCDICLRSFNERQALSAHQEHHKRVQAILDNDGLKVAEPMIMMPVINEADEKVISENFGAGGEGDEAISIIENTTLTNNWDENH
uniref:C2H2-type domain-containing protein n=1 Tax=Meloidogyne enterolobii TaxID=390850 RepID=A0A6V7TNN4_MELEN|nr:unnamed protein product [Meloidogyne enterolobii]